MKTFTLLLSISSIIGCNGQSTTPIRGTDSIPERVTKLRQDEVTKLDSVDIEFQMRGFCYAYSSDKNKVPSEGEAHSVNLPKKVDDKFLKNKLYLLLNNNEFTSINQKYLGCKLYLVNTTDSVLTLEAQDSRIEIIMEAIDVDGKWKPISYNPSSWCGNSYHLIKLDKGEFWEFDIPVFKGLYKTKTRYVLIISKDTRIVSNEIISFINKKQFNKDSKQGHSPIDIMDPYRD